jgi:hypothetical protein
MASTSWLLRMLPTPLIPSPPASCFSSGSSIPARPVPRRLPPALPDSLADSLAAPVTASLAVPLGVPPSGTVSVREEGVGADVSVT